MTDTFLLRFAPQGWLPEERFAQFLGLPFPSDQILWKGVAAVRSHIRKYELLALIATDLASLLEQDDKELAEHGYTPALNGAKFAALIEEMIGELYSVLDGVRQVIFSIYRRERGVQNKFTSKLFRRAAEGSYGKEFPEELSKRLADGYNTWFPKLRSIRSETTHGEIGTCFLDKDSRQVKYMHHSLKEADGRAMIIDDIIGYCNQTYLEIRNLTTWFFSELYRQLEPVERQTLCGIYKGRLYERMVAPSATLSFADGRCLSATWFSSTPDLACPYALNATLIAVLCPQMSIGVSLPSEGPCL
jgi:hypothetical protein